LDELEKLALYEIAERLHIEEKRARQVIAWFVDKYLDITLGRADRAICDNSPIHL